MRPTVYREPRDDELDDADEFKVIFGLKPNPKGTAFTNKYFSLNKIFYIRRYIHRK